MRILVTGGAGFIGSALIRHLIQDTDHSVLNLDKLTYAGNLESLAEVENSERYQFLQADIADRERVSEALLEFQPDAIMHLAAESHVDRSIDGPAEFIQTNIVGTYQLLEAARAYWQTLPQARRDAFRFHHISTDEVYGSLGLDDPSFTETTPYAPNSPYSASKAASDHLVRAYHHTYGLQVTTSNCSNNYGPYQFPEKLIPLFLINCLHGRALPIYGDGMNRRDWLHVEDHCRGIELAITRGRPGEVYNIGGGQELPNMAVIDQICSTVDAAFAQDAALVERFPDAPAARGMPSATLKTLVEDRKGHDRRYAINERKSRDELDYSPRRTFSEGFAATLQWYLANEDWWRPLMKR